MSEPKWIRFVKLPNEQYKTDRWDILTVDGGFTIGRVSWSTGWRRYVFRPGEHSEWEQDCLHDVAAFLEKETKDYKWRRSLNKKT